jgi:hypothetical protein
MSKTAFTLQMRDHIDYVKGVRRTWSFTPASKAFKSIRDYDRRIQKRAEERHALRGEC